MSNPTEEEIIAFAQALAELAEAQKFNKLELYKPYPKQAAFHEAGRTKMERAFIAGNRLGKTEAGAAETVFHATGLYPDWWTGKRFDHPTIGWVGAETGVALTLTVQEKLMGPPGVVSMQGTGMIPKHLVIDTSLARGVTDLYDTIQVRHASGGISTIKFMTYEMGRSKWQGAMVDYIWFDEEPPEDVYSEGTTRLFTRDGIAFCTFTPLKGKKGVVIKYMDEPSEHRVWFNMTIYEAGHLTDEIRAKMLATWPAHEREARANGTPMLGEGAIFPTPEDQIVLKVHPQIMGHWTVLGGLDIGMQHPTACVWTAWDKESDTIYVWHEHRATDFKIAMHASAMRARGGNIPWAWPHDGHTRDKGSGETIAAQYKKEGVAMLPMHSTWPDGSMSTEAAILEIQNREETGRLKYFSSCVNLLEERRWYHRKDGQIVKEKDDLLSALQKCIMMKRYGKPFDKCGGVMARRRGPNGPGGNMASGLLMDGISY